MGFEQVTDHDIHHSDTFREAGSSVHSGDADGEAPLWSLDRQTILARVVQAAGNYTNYSEYAIPGALLGTSDNWDTGNFDHESRMGIVAQGEAIDPDGDLTGTVQVIHNPTDSILYETDVAGKFTRIIPPGQGVTGGADIDNPLSGAKLGLAFAPSFTGLSYVSDTLTEYHTIQYSGIEGTVTDATGDPVEQASVIGQGDGATTDAEGYYSFLAPEETSITLLGLDKTKTKTVTPPSGDKAVVDWQYAGLKIRVQTPQYEPVPSAPVNIDGQEYETDGNGEVIYPVAGLGTEHVVRVFDNDNYTDTVTAPDTEGRLGVTVVGTETSTFGDGSGSSGGGPYSVSLTVLDEATNQPVRNVSVVNPANGIRTSTNGDGVATLVIPTDDDGVADLVVGAESKRYRAGRISVDLISGETAEARIAIAPRGKITKV